MQNKGCAKLRDAPGVVRYLSLVLILCSALFLTGCVETWIEDEVRFRSDGSGTAKVTVAVARSGFGLLASPQELTERFRADLPNGAILTTRQDATWAYWDASFSFQRALDLEQKMNRIIGSGQGDEGIVSTSFDRDGGLLKSSYRYSSTLKITFEGDADLLAPYFRGWTHTVVLPGRIVETNGTISDNQARWTVGANQTLLATATATSTSLGPAIILAAILVGTLGTVAYGLSRRRGQCFGRCPQCTALLSPGARFCENCGKPVAT